MWWLYPVLTMLMIIGLFILVLYLVDDRPRHVPGPVKKPKLKVAIAPIGSCKDSSYIIEGKEYPITKEYPTSFSMKCESGYEIHCLKEGCAHILNNDWIIKEKRN